MIDPTDTMKSSGVSVRLKGVKSAAKHTATAYRPYRKFWFTVGRNSFSAIGANSRSRIPEISEIHANSGSIIESTSFSRDIFSMTSPTWSSRGLKK